MRLVILWTTFQLATAFVPMSQRVSNHAVGARQVLRMTAESESVAEGGEASDEGGSAAMKWKKDQEEAMEEVEESSAKKRIAVIGGGWGGWGAAKALCESGEAEITLLDALPDPTGRTPFLSKTGKPGTFFVCFNCSSVLPCLSSL